MIRLTIKLACLVLALSWSGCVANAKQTPGKAAAESSHLLHVGPGRSLASPSAAAKTAQNGDTVEIDAATYDGDVAVWRQNNLTLKGVGGRPHLRANGRHAEGKAIWVIKGNDSTVENIEFSGATVPDQNGAGIRHEGAGLTVRNCYFHDNENGILTSGNRQSEVLIERSEFARNGFGDGFSHNLYIGPVKRLTVRGVYSHHAKVGHHLKSRALETIVLHSRFADEEDGTSSYDIDLPNGGVVQLIGNVIQQGPLTENPALVAYGREGLRHPENRLYVANNTMINDRPEGGQFVFVAAGTSEATVEKNIFAGKGKPVVGTATLSENRIVADSAGIDRTHAPDGTPVGLAYKGD